MIWDINKSKLIISKKIKVTLILLCPKLRESISSRLLPIPYIFCLSVTNNIFYIFLASGSANYSKDRVKKKLPYIWGKREVCFGNHRKYFSIGDEIDNLLVHLRLLMDNSFNKKGQLFLLVISLHQSCNRIKCVFRDSLEHLQELL